MQKQTLTICFSFSSKKDQVDPARKQQAFQFNNELGHLYLEGELQKSGKEEAQWDG